MMKKLLVLALVLAVAGITNAGLSFQQDPGMENVVNIIGDYTGDAYVAIASDLPIILVGKGAHAPDATGEVVTSAIDAGVTGLDPGFDGPVWTIASFSSIANFNGHLLSVTFDPMVIQTIKVYAVDGADFSATEAASFVTPEPLTMLLLGLGGLFIRRK